MILILEIFVAQYYRWWSGMLLILSFWNSQQHNQTFRHREQITWLYWNLISSHMQVHWTFSHIAIRIHVDALKRIQRLASNSNEINVIVHILKPCIDFTYQRVMKWINDTNCNIQTNIRCNFDAIQSFSQLIQLSKLRHWFPIIIATKISATDWMMG